MRRAVLCVLLVVVLGCGRATTVSSTTGFSVSQMEAELEDLMAEVTSSEPGSVNISPRLDLAAVNLEKAAAGKNFESEVKSIADELAEIGTLLGDASKKDEAVQAIKNLQAKVAGLKGKL